MVIASPLASSEPISLTQEAIPASSSLSFPRTQQVRTPKIPKKPTLTLGIASWYSETDAGINRHTANGEVFDDAKLTCASWYHDFGTLLKVTNLKNGKSVVCRVNDRGPHKRLGRIIDLTITAYRRIADVHSGLVRVSVTKIS